MGFELTFLGLLITLVYIAVTGLYPGGLIVPGYLVLYMDQPGRLLGTWGVAFLTFLCYRLASRYLILFGRRRFVFMILIGGLWSLLWLQLMPVLLPQSMEFRIIGWVVPGLIANQFERQGALLTTASIITVTVFVHFVGRWIVSLV